MDKKQQVYIFVGIFLFIILIYSGKGGFSPSTPQVQGSWDTSSQVEEHNLEQYLVETIDFDFSNPKVYKLAHDIKSSTDSPYEAVKMTAKYVYDNVKYSSKISIQYCYDETASSVLVAGTGDCVSMSRLVTALLRAQGIPARTVGGCLASSYRCSPAFAVYPGLQVQTTDMISGDFKKRGFLHEWVEFYNFENNKWYTIEATSGQIYNTGCQMYLMYSYDTNQYNRCVIDSQSFWNQCKIY